MATLHWLRSADGSGSGVRQGFLSDRLNLRTTFFWNDITNGVVNAHHEAPPRGENERRPAPFDRRESRRRFASPASCSSLELPVRHAVVSSYTPNAAIRRPEHVARGNWTPEVPHQQFTLQARYVNPKILTASLQGTFVGQQFDDDLNSLC